MKKLGDLFYFINGRGFKKTEWQTTGLPIIRIQNLNNDNAEFNYYKGEYDKKIEIKKGDLLFSWSGTIGTSFGPHIWNRETGVLNQHIFKLEFKEEIDRDYAFYGLRFITSDIEKQVNGSVGLVHITKEKLNQFELPLPPLSEQKRIVAILDEAFAGIEKAKENTKKNLQNAKEIFESYLQAVFENKDKSWEEKRLEVICTKITDGVHKKPSYVPYGIPFIKINNLTDGSKISFENVSYITKEDHHLYCKRTKPEKGDILITKDGTIGVVRVIETDIEFSIFVSVALIKPKSKEITPFLKYVLISPLIQNQIKPKGTALKHLYLTDLRKIIIPMPSLKEQQNIVKRFDDLSNETKGLESIYQKKLAHLEGLKASILQKAFDSEFAKAHV